jgi:putative membrane protein
MSTVSASQQTPPKTPPQTTPKASATPPKSQLAAADAAFLKRVATDGMAEMELAEVAQTKASNAEVKALAAKIKDDHTKANQDLKSLASSKNVTLPDAPDKQQAMTKDRFSKMEGKSFDRSYVNAMVTDHRKAVADFTARTKSADADVKAFAEKTLPVLKDHLQRAEALQKTLK